MGIAAAVAAMVVWIGPGSNESMGPMASDRVLYCRSVRGTVTGGV